MSIHPLYLVTDQPSESPTDQPTDQPVDQPTTDQPVDQPEPLIDIDDWFALSANTAHVVALIDNELFDLRRTLHTVREELRGEVGRVTREFYSFKGMVREVAIQAHLDGDYCLDGLNTALRELGLDEYEPSVDVTITVTINATVSGSDESDARGDLWSAVENAVESIDYLDAGSVESITATLRSGW